jgi:3-oxoacid CoA-transferase subunit B
VVDLNITDLALIEVRTDHLVLTEIAEGVTEAEVRAATEAPLAVEGAPRTIRFDR